MANEFHQRPNSIPTRLYDGYDNDKYSIKHDSALSYDKYGSDYGNPTSVSSLSLGYDEDRKKQKFNDFDDESSNYYLSAAASENNYNLDYKPIQRAEHQVLDQEGELSDDLDEDDTIAPIKNTSLEHEDRSLVHLIRRKRQAPMQYQSGYYSQTSAYEEPCHGFPLEINIRSRIKPEDVFPIRGKSQLKKCIKLK